MRSAQGASRLQGKAIAMSAVTDFSPLAAPQRAKSPLKLSTLTSLRWLAIGGQTVAVLGVSLGLRFDFPLWPCLILIALSAALNVALLTRYGAGHRPSPRLAGLQLSFDTLQLGGLLFLTGGVANPFALLVLAPVSVSASTLSTRSTVVISSLAIAVASTVALLHFPLPWFEGAPLVPPPLYIAGMWVSLVAGVIFVAAYTSRVAHEARQLLDALTMTELALSRQQHLSALDGLAAAAAHELGTPLATIALAAKEMRREAANAEVAEDLDLILEQTARCRAILGKLRSLRPGGSDIFDAVDVGDLLAELIKPHEGKGKKIVIRKEPSGGAEPVIPRNVAILYGLGNLIENAVQFADHTVAITVGWDQKRAFVTLSDDGPGFPPELLSRIGEPYLTTRREYGDKRGPDGGGGLGLGVFIAKTLLERSGATLRFSNLRPNGHASVEVSWPRIAFTHAEAGGIL